MSTNLPPTLWIDVTCLTGRNPRPTGISRTVSQMLPHLLADPRLRPRLCRLDTCYSTYRPVDPAEICPPSTTGEPPASQRSSARPGCDLAARWRQLCGRLPRNLRQAVWHQGQSLVCGYGLLKSVYYKGPYRLLPRKERRVDPPFARGDVLFVAGGGWTETGAPALWERLRTDHGVRVVNLVYDITPVRCRHLFDLSPAYAASVPRMLATTDLILTISDFSRQDLHAYGREIGQAVPPVEVIRLGDEAGADDGESVVPDLAGHRPFVLFVSSISLHKNHSLLLQVWRRLIEQHGDRVPMLVLVGGPDWKAEQALAVLDSDPMLAQAVIHLSRANDRQLRWLYRHCLFTLFPSHYEGWGLPVAEGLRHGKYCVCSGATSLPEVGGELVDYHDPLDGVGCLRLVERALFEPGFLARREQRIRNEYQVTTWQSCAAQVVAGIDRHCGVARLTACEAA